MKNELTFTESQKFTQMWVWSIVLIIDVFIFMTIYNFVKNEAESIIESSNGVFLIILLLVLILINFFLIGIKLNYTINNEGIKVRMFPFMFNYKHIKFSELSKIYVRKYNPISDYGGWGYRIGIFGKGRALNVKGNMGLQLEFNNGKKLLIGTQKPDELKEYLMKIERYIE